MGTHDRSKQPLPPPSEVLQEIHNKIPSGLLIFDADGHIQTVNTATLGVLGYELADLVGRHITEILPPDGAFKMAHLERLSESHASIRTKGTVRTRAGALVPVLLCASGLFDDECEIEAVILSFLEIPQRSNVADELSHAQQLESVGKVTAGIAHEINTPVQFIGDSVTFLDGAFEDLNQLLGRYKELRNAAEAGPVDPALIAALKAAEEAMDIEFLEQEIPKSIKRTLDGVSRVAEMTQAVKEFTYPDQNEKVAVDLNAALKTTITVARNEYKYVADLETDLGDLPPVFCHIGHLNQVFLNLIVNAADAIAAIGGDNPQKGNIRIRTRCEGPDVMISISDTGCGIPEEIRDRIFEPFFTTKRAGKGTGQGLAIVHSIVVDKHLGTFDVETELGHGTKFSIRLPVDGQTPLDRGRSA